MGAPSPAPRFADDAEVPDALRALMHAGAPVLLLGGSAQPGRIGVRLAVRDAVAAAESLAGRGLDLRPLLRPEALLAQAATDAATWGRAQVLAPGVLVLLRAGARGDLWPGPLIQTLRAHQPALLYATSPAAAGRYPDCWDLMLRCADELAQARQAPLFYGDAVAGVAALAPIPPGWTVAWRPDLAASRRRAGRTARTPGRGQT
ncbi:hypothetical protein [Oryzihumus leptocrescens]|nr:hypothetical protein [Oryzihumus leptocrescens]